MPAIPAYFQTLYGHYGPQNWWPAQSRFEVIAGAFLTQNTNWRNVEKAVANLRAAKGLSVEGIRGIPMSRLEALIRPAGYFRQKAARLKGFAAWLDTNYSGSLTRMLARPTQELRRELLQLDGIGPETADSILLYAGQHEIFVVDGYTRRIFARHALLERDSPYDAIRAEFESALFETALPDIAPQQQTSSPRHPPSRMSRTPRSPRAQVYNEMHALVVRIGSEYCRAIPRCDQCPLRKLLPNGGPAIARDES